MSQPTPRTQLWVILVLLALLGLSILTAVTEMGPLKPFIGIVIGAAKAVIIALFFMHLRYRAGIVAVFSLAGLVWLAILIGLGLGDYLSRL